MEANPASVPRRGQPHAAAPRRRQVLVRLSDADLAAVKAGAAREGLAVGAWMRELAVRAADDGAGWDLAVSRREVVAQLMRVRVDVAVILAADDMAAVRDRVMAVLLDLDTLIGDAARKPRRQ